MRRPLSITMISWFLIIYAVSYCIIIINNLEPVWLIKIRNDSPFPLEWQYKGLLIINIIMIISAIMMLRGKWAGRFIYIIIFITNILFTLPVFLFFSSIFLVIFLFLNHFLYSTKGNNFFTTNLDKKTLIYINKVKMISCNLSKTTLLFIPIIIAYPFLLYGCDEQIEFKEYSIRYYLILDSDMRNVPRVSSKYTFGYKNNLDSVTSEYFIKFCNFLDRKDSISRLYPHINNKSWRIKKLYSYLNELNYKLPIIIFLDEIGEFNFTNKPEKYKGDYFYIFDDDECIYLEKIVQ